MLSRIAKILWAEVFVVFWGPDALVISKDGEKYAYHQVDIEGAEMALLSDATINWCNTRIFIFEFSVVRLAAI